MSDPGPEISIVVPTRDRPASLSRCLAALEAQDVPSFEVVVVDDGSADAAAVAAAVEAAPRARLVAGAGRGPAAARNLGVGAGSGRAVLFTDDDCVPAPDWARLLAAAAAERPAAGMTLNAAPGAAAAAAQTIADHLRDSSLEAGGHVGFAPTSNLGAPATVLRRLPFDESFPLAAGEDREWCARIAAAGERIRWVPEALVEHNHSMGPAAFLRQQLRYGRGAARFHVSGHAAPAQHRRRPGLYLGFIRSGFAAGAPVGGLVCAAQVATGLGFALERVRPASSG